MRKQILLVLVLVLVLAPFASAAGPETLYVDPATRTLINTGVIKTRLHQLQFSDGLAVDTVVAGKQDHSAALDTLSNSSVFFLSLSPAANATAFKGLLSLTKSDIGLGNVDNTSDANKPVSTAVADALALKVTANGTIVSATKTKITYDAKGLVTSGTDASTADVADSTDRRYVTDAQRVVIQNTSGTNTGDQVISDATISTTDITTNNVSTSKHGFAPKLPNDSTKYLNGAGAYTVPPDTNSGGTVTSFSAGDLSPLFTTTESTVTTTPALTFVLSNAAAHSFFGNETGSTAAPHFVQPAFTDLSGSIADAQIPSTITRDSEWDTIAEIETATGVNIIVSTEIDTSAELRAILTDELGTGVALFDGATPTSFTLTNATGLPISSGVSGLGSGIATLLATPTEANLKLAISGIAYLDTAQTFTAAQTNSYASIASTPAMLYSGSVFTGGSATTTKPHFLIEPTGTASTGWSTSGTQLGVNAVSGFAGNLLDLQIAGAFKFRVDNTGQPVMTTGIGIKFTNRGTFNPTNDGNFSLVNNGGNGFGLLQFGGTTSSFPAIKRSSTTIAFRLADDSADSPISASFLTASSHVDLGTTPNVRLFGSAANCLRISNSAGTDFDRIQIGGTTSSFPALKRSGTAIAFRLADDSADAPITASTVTASGTVTGSNIKAATIVARSTHSTTQSIPDSTVTNINFDTEEEDTDTIHDNATNNHRFTCKTAGVYRISANLGFANNSTGFRELILRVNNATNIAITSQNAVNGIETRMCISTTYRLAVNDFVVFQAYQNSGGALNTEKATSSSPTFTMTWIGP